MSNWINNEDVGDLALLEPVTSRAAQEFCEITNGFLAQLYAWRKEYSTHGADDTASKEAQRDVLTHILKDT